ncbi:MAG: hypothetical protein JST80_11110 [Bdellovibrionales bacterium]|nr:hypothetical protein [Bdellovibrionales bacterium]
MKTTLKIRIGTLTLFGALSANAAILNGTVTGTGMLSCMMYNFTGQDQVLDQVQYQYMCNGMMQFQFTSGFGVLVRNGSSYWHTNGPMTMNCALPIYGQCMGYTHPAPTPIPTPTAFPVDGEQAQQE